MKTAIIKVISMMVILVAVQAYVAYDSFSQYSGSCPGYLKFSLEGFTYTMTAWFTGVRGGEYYAEAVMYVDARPIFPGFSSHKLVGYYFTYGYAGFRESPEE